jgi:hypothetical protein
VKPIPEEIEARLLEMSRGLPRSEVDEDLKALWWVEAIDPDGEVQGYGTDLTLSGSLVAAWILAWDEDVDQPWSSWPGKSRQAISLRLSMQ